MGRVDRGDGTYDIDYDDGERESRVKEELIRSLERASSPARPKLREGDKVEANYRGRGKYYSGKIKYDNHDGTYDIEYDDGEKERGVKEADIRSLETRGQGDDSGNVSAKLREGDKVEANYGGRGKYYSGKIRVDRGDGTYDIEYDDGERESRVKEELIRSLERASSPACPKLRELDKVEA